MYFYAVCTDTLLPCRISDNILVINALLANKVIYKTLVTISYSLLWFETTKTTSFLCGYPIPYPSIVVCGWLTNDVNSLNFKDMAWNVKVRIEC